MESKATQTALEQKVSQGDAAYAEQTEQLHVELKEAKQEARKFRDQATQMAAEVYA
jgi:hypothetical protein